jgi:hypothetical protein
MDYLRNLPELNSNIYLVVVGKNPARVRLEALLIPPHCEEFSSERSGVTFFSCIATCLSFSYYTMRF